MNELVGTWPLEQNTAEGLDKFLEKPRLKASDEAPELFGLLKNINGLDEIGAARARTLIEKFETFGKLAKAYLENPISDDKKVAWDVHKVMANSVFFMDLTVQSIPKHIDDALREVEKTPGKRDFIKYLEDAADRLRKLAQRAHT
jgi:hypothetical protein